MEWYDVSTKVRGEQDPERRTCIGGYPKVGSMAMREALGKTQATQITAEQALDYNFRVTFVRDPISRFRSFFNFASNHTRYRMFCRQFLPEGTITGEGYKVEGTQLANQHLDTQKMLNDYGVKYALEKSKGAVDSVIALRFHEQDWRRWVDHVLAGNNNEHWDSQVEMATLNGVYIPNIAHKFEEIQDHWQTYVPGSILEQLNSSIPVPHSNYKEDEILANYQADLDFHGGIDGTWYAS